MNLYAYGILGLGLMVSIAWGAVERGNANNWHGKYDSLQASYISAADKARADALAQEAKDKAALETQSSKAIQQAQSQAQQAQNQLQAYLAKGKASKGTDLGHQCFNVMIPADLLPEQK